MFRNSQLYYIQRRERDSNPRYLSVRRFSRPVHSTTLPSLQQECVDVASPWTRLIRVHCSFASAKVHILFKTTKFLALFLSLLPQNHKKVCSQPALFILLRYEKVKWLCISASLSDDDAECSKSYFLRGRASIVLRCNQFAFAVEASMNNVG